MKSRFQLQTADSWDRVRWFNLIAKRVQAIAKTRRTSANRILVELIETGLESKEAEKQRFFEPADKLSASTDANEQQHLKEELARMTFGE